MQSMPKGSAICKRMHLEHKHPCNHCPIFGPCSSGSGSLSWENLDAWHKRVEAAAENHIHLIEE